MRLLESREHSEFLYGQMTEWMESLSEGGRTEYLFELEMWLKCFERYFRVRNQPMSTDSERTLAIRSFYEEVGLVSQAIRRVNQLCMFLSSEDQVNQERFDKYVENYLRKDDIVDPYVGRLLRRKSPQAGLTLLRESFEDLQLVLSDLTKLSRIPYQTFQSIGRLIYREIRRNDYLGLMIDKKFKAQYDRISNESIGELLYRVRERKTRRLVAKIFLELFRLLHYLEYADPRRRERGELRTTILIFTLVASETRNLLEQLRIEMARSDLHPDLRDTIERYIYVIPLELRKVLDTELTDISSFKQADSIYISIENSHGILRDCYQQSVIQLAQVFEPEIEGREVFGEYANRLEQSLMLKEDLTRLVAVVERFNKNGEAGIARRVQQSVSLFYHRSLRHLMYRDWASFEMFSGEIANCDSISGLKQITHRFEAYLRTLLREISKRSVLRATSDTQPKGTEAREEL
jgi:hypothetical protein